MMDKELLIIIPAYNEDKNLGALLDDMEKKGVKQIGDILLINDASEDLTEFVAARRDIRMISNVFNLGYGCGLQTGYKYAFRRKYKYVIQMDADGQHDPCNIETIYKALKTADANGKKPDIVLGSRFMEGSSSYPVSFVKRLAVKIFSAMIKAGTGKKIMDCTTGLQGLSRRTFLYYSRYNHFDDMYPDANMIMQMELLGFRIKEIPAIMHERREGKSMHSGIGPFIYIFWMMFSIIAVYIRIKLYRADMRLMDDENEP